VKLEFIQKVELSEAQVQKIIGEYVADVLGISDHVIGVESKTGSRVVGYHTDEHDEIYFDGITVTFHRKVEVKK